MIISIICTHWLVCQLNNLNFIYFNYNGLFIVYITLKKPSRLKKTLFVVQFTKQQGQIVNMVILDMEMKLFVSKRLYIAPSIKNIVFQE